MAVALIKRRDNLLLEQTVNRFSFCSFLSGLIGLDQPPVRTGIAFSPPTVGNAQMRNAVNGSLHSACTAGFEWLAWIVEPHIASLDQEMRHVQVVLIDECNAPAESNIDSAAVDPLQDALTRFIGWTCLSCEDELNRLS